MKICLVSPVPPPYGGIAHWTTLVHRATASFERISIIQIDTTPSWRKIDDFSVWKRSFGGGVQLFRDIFFFLSALLQRPVVVHLVSSAELGIIRDLIICLIARLFSVPVAYHLHFGRVPQIAKANTLEWRILTLNLRLATITISITPETAEVISKYLPNTCIEYIPNPIPSHDNSDFVENKSANRQVLYLGWIIPTKGINELVEAWAGLNIKDWELLIVGPGNTAYQAELVVRHKPNNLKFISEVKHEKAMQLIAQSDLFVLPSYTEGFPNVILEAMICGKPIIATSVGAIPDMLSGNCGLVIGAQDVDELKRALITLIENQDLRRDLGLRARERALQNYSMNIIFDKYVNIWERLSKKQND